MFPSDHRGAVGDALLVAAATRPTGHRRKAESPLARAFLRASRISGCGSSGSRLLTRVEHGGGFLLLGDPPGDPEHALAGTERSLAQA